ncbi:MAG TPA: hypothetical protein VMG12_43865 [Polyangiaceae bacterium]|nr:hypothetical protein [Polyangiaceae bacterium]
MSCPKCEPAARSKRWVWWVGAAVLLVAGAWLDRSRGAADPAPRAAPATVAR